MLDKLQKIKFAIAGCGKIATRHAEQIIKHGELVGCCDIIPAKADVLAKKFNTKAIYNFKDLLQLDVDVIVICTPNYLHCPQTVEALNAGFNVICEKPMALTSYDCSVMETAAQKNNKHLFIVKQNRFNEPVKFVKKLIDDGKLGTIHNIQVNCFWNRNDDYYNNTWRGKIKTDGGILFTQFSHFIDIMFWFLGDVENVCGFSGNYLHKNSIEFSDSGVAAIKFKNGATGSINYSVNAYNKNMEGSITVFGEKGTIKIGGEYLNLLEYFEVEGLERPELPESATANNYGTYRGSMSNHDKVYDNVLEVITKSSVPYTTTKESLKCIEIIEKINNANN
ncbi:MAG: Gfo/Idh/MocA family oxidoreductase [Bacteroidetes bacterium]|nr:Gfo/Idh/MocA family oxidoreductase [Bacteroidota bacterium]